MENEWMVFLRLYFLCNSYFRVGYFVVQMDAIRSVSKIFQDHERTNFDATAECNLFRIMQIRK